MRYKFAVKWNELNEMAKYLKLSGIEGRTREKSHFDWLLISQVEHAGPVRPGDVHRETLPLVITRPVDAASLQLVRAFTAERVFDRLDLDVITAVPNCGRVTIWYLEMKGAVIRAHHFYSPINYEEEMSERVGFSADSLSIRIVDYGEDSKITCDGTETWDLRDE